MKYSADNNITIYVWAELTHFTWPFA